MNELDGSQRACLAAHGIIAPDHQVAISPRQCN